MTPTSKFSNNAATALALLLCCLCAGCVSSEAFRSEISRRRSARYEMWAAGHSGKPSDFEALSGPLGLDESMLIALANSRQIQTAFFEKSKAGARITGAHSKAYPTALLDGAYARLDPPPPPPPPAKGTADIYSVRGTVTQPLYRGGLISAGIRAARLFSLLADEQERGVFQSVLYDVRKAYYDALLEAELARAAAEAMVVAQRRLDDVHKDREVGRASSFDILRAEVELKNLTATHLGVRNRFRQAIASLLNAMGVSQDSDVTLTYALKYDPIHPTIEDAVRAAFHNHPDIQQRELEARIQKQAVAAAKSEHYPSVDLFFTEGYDRPDSFDPTRDEWEESWTAGATFSLPIFNGFRVLAKVREETAALRQREIALRDTEEATLLAIRRAMLDLEDASKVVESQVANVDQAREALRLAELGFKQGRLKQIDFLDARRALTRAQATHAQAIYRYELARLEFERATGALKPPATPETTRNPSQTPPSGAP